MQNVDTNEFDQEQVVLGEQRAVIVARNERGEVEITQCARPDDDQTIFIRPEHAIWLVLAILANAGYTDIELIRSDGGMGGEDVAAVRDWRPEELLTKEPAPRSYGYGPVRNAEQVDADDRAKANKATTNAERQSRYRERKRNAYDTGTVTRDRNADGEHNADADQNVTQLLIAAE